jgi:ABC-type sugar transport system permease subunit
VPPPMPADRAAQGIKPITWGGGYSLVIPSTSRNKIGAWKLIQFLTSKQTMTRLEDSRREQKEAEGRLYLPHSPGNRVVFEELVAKHVDNNPAMPPSFRHAYNVARELMPQTMYRPVTPVGQLLWNQHREAMDAGLSHGFSTQAHDELAEKKARGEVTDDDIVNYEMHLALENSQRPAQKMLDEILAPSPPETKVNWTPWFVVYAMLVITPLGLMLLAARRRKSHYSRSEVGASLLFLSPWIIGFVVFVGGPIFFSIIFSFTRYDVLSPAHSVGHDNFRQLLQDKYFYQSLWNTAVMIVRVPLTMTLSLVLALLLNRAMRGLSFYRTLCYMPAHVPVVAGALLWTLMFIPGNGVINSVILWFYQLPPMEWLQRVIDVRFTAPMWLWDKNWSKPALILMSIWSAGGGIIIWLAGLQSIPAQLYEAASIDGANAWRRFWNVTFPMLSPYILFNAIIGVIRTMQIFDEAFVMTRGGPDNSTLFYAYHLFRNAFQYFRMGYASAMAWILFLIVMALTILQLWGSRRWVHYDRT